MWTNLSPDHNRSRMSPRALAPAANAQVKYMIEHVLDEDLTLLRGSLTVALSRARLCARLACGRVSRDRERDARTL